MNSNEPATTIEVAHIFKRAVAAGKRTEVCLAVQSVDFQLSIDMI